MTPELMPQNKIPSEENPHIPEREKAPRIYLMISRHTERMPSGELTPEGLVQSQEKGFKIGQEAEVFKSYTSKEKSDRTYLTAEAMSQAADIESPLKKDREIGERRYGTRRRDDLAYEVILPDFKRFDSLKFLLKGINIPLETVGVSLGYTALYAGICLFISSVIFKKREFL